MQRKWEMRQAEEPERLKPKMELLESNLRTPEGLAPIRFKTA
jgi:hypothetical protein